MAKIEYHKLSEEPIKCKKIKSITNFDDNVKNNLLIRQQILLRKQCATYIKAKDIVISSQSADNETNPERNF